jgi:mono/diheme cytochrome c family protein
MLRALAITLPLSMPTLAAEPLDEKAQRGRDLHDMTCKGCHDDEMYIKRELSRNPYFDVRRQAQLWLLVMDVKWSEQQLDAVVHYLKTRFYTHER